VLFLFTEEFISASIGWRRAVFHSLWNSLEESSRTVSTGAFTSVCVLQQSREDLRAKLIEELHECIVEENKGNTTHNTVQASLPDHNGIVHW
jgi:hypothetical protein